MGFETARRTVKWRGFLGDIAPPNSLYSLQFWGHDWFRRRYKGLFAFARSGRWRGCLRLSFPPKLSRSPRRGR